MSQGSTSNTTLIQQEGVGNSLGSQESTITVGSPWPSLVVPGAQHKFGDHMGQES